MQNIVTNIFAGVATQYLFFHLKFHVEKQAIFNFHLRNVLFVLNGIKILKEIHLAYMYHNKSKSYKSHIFC